MGQMVDEDTGLAGECFDALLRNENEPSADVTLQALTRDMRGDDVECERIGIPSRMFFDAVEPFLVDGDPPARRRGEIARASLGAIWAWISRDLLPTRSKRYCDLIDQSLLANDWAALQRVARAFQGQVAKCLERALATTAHEVIRDRLAFYEAPRRGFDDLREILTVLKRRGVLAALAARLPPEIRNFDGQDLERTRIALQKLARTDGEMVHYGLILVMRRLAAPWQLVRLAFLSEDGHGAARRTPYSVAVGLVLRDSEEMMRRLRADLQTADAPMTAAALTHVETAIKGLHELDLPTASVWARRLSALRSDFAVLKRAEAAATVGADGEAFSLAHSPAKTARA